MGLSLLDIAPQSKTVAGVDVFGISAEGIACLFPRFPELQQLMKGESLSPSQIIKTAPKAIAAIIAAGCGNPGSELAESIAAKLAVETQLDFLQAIGELTFTNGFGPFVKRLESLSAAVSASSGKVAGMNSRQASKAS